MATTKEKKDILWNTFHENGPWKTQLFLDTYPEKEGNLPDPVARYNDAADEIRRLLQDSLNARQQFRPQGSAWSLSKVAHCKDRMHYNGRLNLRFSVASNDLHASSAFDSTNIHWFQCGNLVKEVNTYLDSKGKALKASGASNGQTLAGAISTGVHGAAFDYGALQDCVVGLNLIIGPKETDVVYLERASEPVLSDAYLQRFQCRVIRNDGLFNAALVSMGAFGFIHGIVIEAEDRYLLKRYTKHITKAEAMHLAHTLDFANSPFKIPGEVDAQGKGLRPYHYKLYINPYNSSEPYITEVIYKKPYRADYPNPIPVIKTAAFRDLPSFMANFAAKHKRLIPALIGALKGSIFPPLDKEAEGTIGEIFWDSIHQGPAFACSMGVDHRNSQKALDLFVDLINREGPVPGAIALRFVKQSRASLAFTKFPITCIVEMDGLLWEGNRKMISLPQFTKRIVEVYQQHNLDFTLHWGKNSAWDYPGLAEYMYGNKVQEWKDYRSSLMERSSVLLFNNEFLRKAKLAGYNNNPPPGLV